MNNFAVAQKLGYVPDKNKLLKRVVINRIQLVGRILYSTYADYMQFNNCLINKKLSAINNFNIY